ncbi:MAG: TIGR02679 family protein, partial [Solirubrobacteraceae bacterium]
MGPGDRDRLTRLLGDPELAWVLARARRRLELGQPVHGTIVLRSATAGQRAAVARLVGRAP